MCLISKFALKNGLLKESNIFTDKIEYTCFLLSFCFSKKILRKTDFKAKNQMLVSQNGKGRQASH